MIETNAKNFYVLLCDDSKYNPSYDPMICGVFSTRKEAQECADAVKDCPLKHVIKKCDVSVNFYARQQQSKRHTQGRAAAKPGQNAGQRA